MLPAGAWASRRAGRIGTRREYRAGRSAWSPEPVLRSSPPRRLSRHALCHETHGGMLCARSGGAAEGSGRVRQPRRSVGWTVDEGSADVEICGMPLDVANLSVVDEVAGVAARPEDPALVQIVAGVASDFVDVIAAEIEASEH